MRSTKYTFEIEMERERENIGKSLDFSCFVNLLVVHTSVIDVFNIYKYLRNGTSIYDGWNTYTSQKEKLYEIRYSNSRTNVVWEDSTMNWKKILFRPLFTVFMAGERKNRRDGRVRERERDFSRWYSFSVWMRGTLHLYQYSATGYGHMYSTLYS